MNAPSPPQSFLDEAHRKAQPLRFGQKLYPEYWEAVKTEPGLMLREWMERDRLLRQKYADQAAADIAARDGQAGRAWKNADMVVIDVEPTVEALVEHLILIKARLARTFRDEGILVSLQDTIDLIQAEVAEAEALAVAEEQFE